MAHVKVSPPRSCLDVVPADFLSGAWHQEVGCLLNQAEVNMPCEEKGANIPQMEWGSTCQRSANKKTWLHLKWVHGYRYRRPRWSKKVNESMRSMWGDWTGAKKKVWLCSLTLKSKIPFSKKKALSNTRQKSCFTFQLTWSWSHHTRLSLSEADKWNTGGTTCSSADVADICWLPITVWNFTRLEWSVFAHVFVCVHSMVYVCILCRRWDAFRYTLGHRMCLP